MEPVAFVPAREDAARHIELDALKILFHEYYHHFMFRYFAGAYPGWYIEGIAELHSTLRFMPNGAFHVGDAPQARAEELMGKYKSFAHYSIVEMLTSKSKPTPLFAWPAPGPFRLSPNERRSRFQGLPLAPLGSSPACTGHAAE